MRAVVTRVSSASVSIDGATVGGHRHRLSGAAGHRPQRHPGPGGKRPIKSAACGSSADEAGKMNLNLAAVGGPCWWSPSSPCTPISRAAGPGSPRPRPWRWPFPCMRPFWTLPGTGLPGGARGVRRGHGGAVGERRPVTTGWTTETL